MINLESKIFLNIKPVRFPVFNYLIELLRVLFIRKRVRNRNQVSIDYDQGAWSNLLNEKLWKRHDSLESFLRRNSHVDVVSKVNRKVYQIDYATYFDYKVNVLNQSLKIFFDQDKPLVELGAGYGENLFWLTTLNEWSFIKGFEISNSGLQVFDEIKNHYDVKKCDLGHIDFTDSNSEAWSELKDNQVFTYFSFEQIKYDTETSIRNLINAGVKRVVHIENTYELLDDRSLADIVNKLYIYKMDYQDNLLRTLTKLEDEGLLKIIHKQRLLFSPTLRNDPTLICWERVEKP